MQLTHCLSRKKGIWGAKISTIYLKAILPLSIKTHLTRLRYYFVKREIGFPSGPATSTFLLAKLYVEIAVPTLAGKYADLLLI